mgnify:CR=1 FL=1
MNPDPLENLTDDQISELIKSNDALDEEKARIVKEEMEEKERKELEQKAFQQRFRRLRKSPIEIINRSLFFIFLGSFFFSFTSVYSASKWWFILYVISAFSCILYTPNRKALKELIAAWPNIEELLRNKRK